MHFSAHCRRVGTGIQLGVGAESRLGRRKPRMRLLRQIRGIVMGSSSLRFIILTLASAFFYQLSKIAISTSSHALLLRHCSCTDGVPYPNSELSVLGEQIFFESTSDLDASMWFRSLRIRNCSTESYSGSKTVVRKGGSESSNTANEVKKFRINSVSPSPSQIIL